MAKQTRFMIVLLLAVSGIAVWQNYELRMAQKSEKRHVAQMAHHGAYYLYTTQQQIKTFSKENSWDDKETRESFRIWLAKADQSLHAANSALRDFPSQVSPYMNDIYIWFLDWWMEAANILSKSGPLTKEDKARISELSNIVAKVDGFYVSTANYYDWDGISIQLASLHDEWKKVKGIQ